MCAISVCKAWRSLRDEPELWRDINLADRFMPRDAPQFDGDNLLRLVSWLHNPAEVTSLALECGDKPGSYHVTAPLPITVEFARTLSSFY